MTSNVYPEARIYGPYFHSKHKRWYVIVFWSKEIKKMLLLSRFRMQEYLNRELDSKEHVDHKDNNPRNDDLNNLQVLINTDHNTKTHLKYEDEKIEVCEFCNQPFVEDRKQQYKRTEARKRGGKAYCSRICSNNARHW